MKTELTVENKIAFDLNAGTEISERELAEKHEVPRSVVRRVKANIEKYTVVETVDVVEAKKIINQAFGIDNIEKLLKSKSANKKPADISVIIFNRSEGDFALFSKQMNGKSSAYIKDQFLRCVNLNKDSQ
ncbi:hypothetical protein M8Q05_01635 [Enterobacter hormaechei]|uniref:hypothetical protein n=1 Tax=Enterobacter hormaechei TaxID=158836 RepID=UPI00094F95B6|nr:hypothetical protein [Enterobacter hormaechei]MCU3648368.1 hypothetical protein [Enterobacter hormaechei subsp. xiangfangensis]MCM7111911.1 hypothetical protein [Enterobacter hormaechei]MCO6617500.1 hypothetical protein [Enterobacter hormaechei]MDX7056706.1 hypothetical protein [Enterobacter hormaechei]PZA27823.1 hypothetical protein C7B73_02015 [Enterobacter hormaechei]